MFPRRSVASPHIASLSLYYKTSYKTGQMFVCIRSSMHTIYNMFTHKFYNEKTFDSLHWQSLVNQILCHDKGFSLEKYSDPSFRRPYFPHKAIFATQVIFRPTVGASFEQIINVMQWSERQSAAVHTSLVYCQCTSHPLFTARYW